jgi:hypothetical protein
LNKIVFLSIFGSTFMSDQVAPACRQAGVQIPSFAQIEQNCFFKHFGFNIHERPSRACLPAGRGSDPVFRSN